MAGDESEKLSTSLQESILTLLCFGRESGQIAAGMLKPEYWEEPYRDIATRAIAYRQKYGAAPGREHIDDLFDHVLLDPANKRAPTYQHILVNTYRQSEGLNEKYVLDRIGQFVRHQTYKSVIYRAGQRMLQNDDAETMDDDVESILGEAHRFRAENLDAGLFLDDETAALSFLDEASSDTLKLGIPIFDRYDINPTRKELFGLMAPRGRGKTWGSVHCAVMALLQRWRTAYVSCEVRAPILSQRIHQTMFAVAKHNDEYMQTIMKKDTFGRLEDLISETRRPEMSIRSNEIRDYLHAKREQWADRLGYLNVKHFPSGMLTMRKLTAHLDFLEQSRGFMPDLLVVDYPMIMKLDEKDRRGSLGQHFVDIRGLADERNLAAVVLHQSNRGGEDAVNLRSKHTGEDISFFATCDTILTYNATEAERKRDLARLFAAKVRNDRSDIEVLLTQNYSTGQFCIDSAPRLSGYWDKFNSFAGAIGADEIAEEEDGA